MAGRKHHYLPRFLQRPFAYKQRGKHFYVYAHHRAHGTYGTNVMELGQELDFYGGPEDTSLDDAMTEAERELGITVNRLNAQEPIEPEACARLICALSFRTKGMRNALTETFPVIFEIVRERLFDGRELYAELNRSMHDPVTRRQLIYQQLRKDNPHFSREQHAQLYLKMLPRWKALVAQHQQTFVDQAHVFIDQVMTKFEKEAETLANRAFLGALSRVPATTPRMMRMVEEMKFTVWEATDEERFILGDCGPVALFTDGQPRLALGSIEDETHACAVFLPISPARCIVGQETGFTHTLSVADLNQISASLSHEFFVSSLPDGDALTALRSSIGSRVPIVSDDEMRRMLRETG